MTNVLEWLEKRAQEMPDKVAFADEHDEVSFLDLMRRAREAIAAGEYAAFERAWMESEAANDY